MTFQDNDLYDNNFKSNNSMTSDLNRLLLENKHKSIENTIKYIFYLTCLIICVFISAIILFAIYYFTHGHKDNEILYKFSCICFIVALILSCCLCSCMKYKCELEKIRGPFIFV